MSERDRERERERESPISNLTPGLHPISYPQHTTHSTHPPNQPCLNPSVLGSKGRLAQAAGKEKKTEHAVHRTQRTWLEPTLLLPSHRKPALSPALSLSLSILAPLSLTCPRKKERERETRPGCAMRCVGGGCVAPTNPPLPTSSAPPNLLFPPAPPMTPPCPQYEEAELYRGLALHTSRLL